MPKTIQSEEPVPYLPNLKFTKRTLHGINRFWHLVWRLGPGTEENLPNFKCNVQIWSYNDICTRQW